MITPTRTNPVAAQCSATPPLAELPVLPAASASTLASNPEMPVDSFPASPLAVCFDDPRHPQTGCPMQKSTRMQTDDLPFAEQCAQRCVGHQFDQSFAIEHEIDHKI